MRSSSGLEPRCSLSKKSSDSALGLNHANILRGDQNIDLFEKPLKMFLISPEKSFSLPVGAGDDFNLNDVVDKLRTSNSLDREQIANLQ